MRLLYGGVREKLLNIWYRTPLVSSLILLLVSSVRNPVLRICLMTLAGGLAPKGSSAQEQVAYQQKTLGTMIRWESFSITIGQMVDVQPETTSVGSFVKQL